MNGIIDLNGNPLELSKLKDFRIGTVEYIMQPAFRENIHVSQGLFKMKSKIRLDYDHMEPYGVILGRYQGFDLNTYYPRSFDEAINLKIAMTGQSIIQGMGDIVTDIFRINRAEKKPYQIRKHSGVTEINRLCDIPVKVLYANGQIADMPKNDERFETLRMHTESAIVDVQALLVLADRPIVVFGNGIDVPDVQPLYNLILETKREMIREQEDERLKIEQQKREQNTRPGINLLGINIPPISLPGLFGGNTNNQTNVPTQNEEHK